MFHYKVIRWKRITRSKAVKQTISYTTLPVTNVWTLTQFSWGNSTHALNVSDFYYCSKLSQNQWCKTAHMYPLVFLRSERCQQDRVLWGHSRKHLFLCHFQLLVATCLSWLAALSSILRPGSIASSRLLLTLPSLCKDPCGSCGPTWAAQDSFQSLKNLNG